ncbi:MAG: bifunctional pyr operon transcriptional regulator/uracil phosphoribosyltransferase PyrR [Arenicellales bacterium]|jgi:pyrimidine operon attenuation protein/uracil phosphoribosyltransferase
MKQIPLEPILATMVEDIRALRLDQPLIIGIHTGGAWIATQLHESLETNSLLGTLDISFYRDDFSRVGLNPKVQSSDLPEPVEGRHILLVDDVLHTGRTIRAAMNEIFSFGRPASIKLAVALERPGRELPIAADIIGKTMELETVQQAKICRTDSGLQFEIVTQTSSSD